VQQFLEKLNRNSPYHLPIPFLATDPREMEACVPQTFIAAISIIAKKYKKMEMPMNWRTDRHMYICPMEYYLAIKIKS